MSRKQPNPPPPEGAVKPEPPPGPPKLRTELQGKPIFIDEMYLYYEQRDRGRKV